jgi:uncharacterized membrane protein
MVVLATGVALGATRYFSLNPVVFIPAQVPVYLAHLGPLILHISGGVVALTIGPWQFRTSLRTSHPRVHRWMGRVYVVSALAAGVGGLLLAPISQGGPLAHLGFAVLGALLLATTALAFVAIKRRRFVVHRAWMTRSYALVFTAVTFRLWLVMGALAGLPADQVYAVGSWTTWLIDLLAAELLLARLGSRPVERAISA